jgi:hypothetical protein
VPRVDVKVATADIGLLDYEGAKGGRSLMSTTRRERFVKTIALLAFLVTALMVVLGSAQAQNNNRSN